MEWISYVIKDAITKKIGNLPLHFYRNGTQLSHILVADDMVLFGESTGAQIEVIFYYLNKLCESPRAKVSVQKTKIFFSKNTKPSCSKVISEWCSFDQVTNLGKYLGTPVIHGCVTKATLSGILDTVKQWLSGWYAEKLSFARRLILIQFVLSAIPACTMQTSALPFELYRNINKITRRFL